MNPVDEKMITDFRGEFDAPAELKLVAENTAIGLQMRDFCKDLSRLTPGIQIREIDAEPHAFPGIYAAKNIVFHVIPEGKLMESFLQAVYGDALQTLEREIPAHTILRKIRVPARLKIYVSPACPFCPRTVSQGVHLARATAMVELAVIDASVFTGRAGADHIRSVPTLLLDNRFRWTGMLDLKELVTTLETGTPDRLSAETMQKIIADGHADALAHLLIDFQTIPTGLLDVLRHEKWPVRLGAMVVFEYILEADVRMAGSILNGLWQHFFQVPDPIKGDILHLFSVYGQPSVVPKLRNVFHSQVSDEIKSIAEEILFEITLEG